MRPMARSAASIERSVVRELSWSFELDSLTEGSWTWPPASMFTPPVRALSILEKLRLLSREEPLKVVPFRVKDMPCGMLVPLLNLISALMPYDFRLLEKSFQLRESFRADLTSAAISYLARSSGRSRSVLVWDLPSPKVKPYLCFSSLQTRTFRFSQLLSDMRLPLLSTRLNMRWQWGLGVLW